MLKEIIQLTKEALKTYNTTLEIKQRRLILDEQEKIEDEIRDLEKEIARMRRANQFDAANLLLKREARRARFRVRLDNIEKGRDLRGSKGHGPG